jgi:cysteine-S-conjugate beta-lyase
MKYDFDAIIERRGTDSAKWHYYGPDVLPMWVADMDFLSPEPVRQALHKRIDHGVFGYGGEVVRLQAAICARLHRFYRWQVQPEDILFLPGLVSGLNIVTRAIGAAGDGVLSTTPVYGPFLSAPVNQDRVLQTAELAVEQQGQRLRYTVDYDALRTAVQPNTRLFLLCNPHNPIGRAYSREELLRMADLALRHKLVICSDEIHCDLLLGETRHTPLASLDPEIAQQTVTLMAPSKTFNLPGLGCSLAIVQNPALRRQLQKTSAGIVPHVNLLGYVAALAAYTECEDWLAKLQGYLTANRDYLLEQVAQHFPAVRITSPEATYLAWLDCRALGLADNPFKFFLEQAKVALADGANFGPTGVGFVRLNFGCPRPLLAEGLARMQAVLAKASQES